MPLGAYTLAEIDAVNGVIDFIEREPAPELVAEAVRSLAARNLITTEPGADEVQVRGDLGIALAFQERARIVLDARVTGSEPDRPWRFLLMPQPEGVTLEVLIDALGIHFYALRTTDDALERLWERLPARRPRAQGGGRRRRPRGQPAHRAGQRQPLGGRRDARHARPRARAGRRHVPHVRARPVRAPAGSSPRGWTTTSGATSCAASPSPGRVGR